MSDYFFTESHECFKLEDGVAVVSITEYAVEQLGEITYVQLPGVNQDLSQGDSFGEIESVKTVSELYAPIAGSVSEVNADLESSPETVNDDPLGKGWLIKLKVDGEPDTSKLMDRAAYDSYLESLR